MQEYSFLMSVYHKERPEYLKESIDSMLSQTVLPKSIILVEDGKLTDELYSVINGYTNTYSHLFDIIQLEKNVGLGSALNHGIQKRKTELIARMDSDDICLPERCEKQLKVFENNPSLDIVGTQIDEFIDIPSNIVSSRIVPCTNEEILKFSRRRSPFNHVTVMYKKTSIINSGCYGGYRRKEDLELFIKMMNTGCKAANIDESLVLVRTNTENLKRRTTWQNCSEYIEIMFSFYKKHYLNLLDLMYVLIGQIAMFVIPKKLLKIISDKCLRKIPKNIKAKNKS